MSSSTKDDANAKPGVFERETSVSLNVSPPTDRGEKPDTKSKETETGKPDAKAKEADDNKAPTEDKPNAEAEKNAVPEPKQAEETFMELFTPEILENCMNMAKAAAKDAGVEIIAGLRSKKAAVVGTKFNANDFVTETDKKCEQMISSSLLSASQTEIEAKNPKLKFAFIGEESAPDNANNDLTNQPTWIVDPMDGTTNFVHGIPQVTISIGLVVDKVPVVGVVYHPTANEMFHGYKGGGCFLNGKPANVSTIDSLKTAALATEYAYDRSEQAVTNACKRLKALLDAGLQAPRVTGSTCLSMAYVAVGRFDVFFFGPFTGPKAWDVCAGRLLIEEAGGKVTDLNGGDHDMFNGKVLATNGTAVHTEVVSTLRFTDGDGDDCVGGECVIS